MTRKAHALYITALTFSLVIGTCTSQISKATNTPTPTQTVSRETYACPSTPAVNCGECSQEPRPLPTDAPAPPTEVTSKWDLWRLGTALRGANIWQAAMYKGRDRTEFTGMETSYDDQSFEKLRRWGANYVNISHAGTFSEQPRPLAGGRAKAYQELEKIRKNLLDLIAMSAAREMFVVVSFRTGPGRNELVFEDKDKSGLNTALFATDAKGNLTEAARAARKGWVDMWREAAKRLKNVPNVVGYDLMVEPVTDREKSAGVKGQEHWFSLALELVEAIRKPEDKGGADDTTTPIIIGGAHYSAACSLSCMRPADFASYGRIVYAIHQYDPYDLYTHQPNKFAAYNCDEERKPVNKKPKGDHAPHLFDKDVREPVCDRYAYVNGFKSKHSVPVVVNEFGAVRWAGAMKGEQGCTKSEGCRDADQFLTFHMGLIERLGANHALWLWETSDCIDYDSMNFQHGADPLHHQDILPGDEEKSRLIEAIKTNWRKNIFYATPEVLERLRTNP